MTKLAASLAAVCLVLFSVSGASATDLQILCANGAAVRLDGAAMGACSELENGRYLRDLAPGRHVVEVQGSAGQARRYEVDLEGRIPARLDAREPVVPETRHGFLYIVSEPESCTVRLAGTDFAKDDPAFRVTEVPVGRHPLRFVRGDKVLEMVAEVREGKVTGVKADFVRGRAGYLTPAEVPPPDDPEWRRTSSLDQLVRFQEMRDQLDADLRKLEDQHSGRKPPG